MNQFIGLRQADRLTASLQPAVELLGGRWKCLLLSQLLIGAMQMAELKNRIPTVLEGALRSQLEELKQSGLVAINCLSNEADDAEEYDLTPLGRTLEPILLALQCWGERYESYCARQDTFEPVHIYRR